MGALARLKAEMKTILIFEPQSGGHRANFIRWISEASPEYSNCRLVCFTADNVEASVARKIASAGRWTKQMLLYRLFRQACREYAPDHALILELTHLELPLALFGSPVPLSAILFVQYPELPRGLKFFYKHWKTRMLLWRAPVQNLFLLNGEKSCRYLTKWFEGAQTRFVAIPDPAPETAVEGGFSLRDYFNIPAERKIFLFFGSISRRKGADVLLKALRKIGSDVAAQGAFVFCGAPEPAYQHDFQQACGQLRSFRSDVMLCVEENFISDERMMAFFEQSDVVLMPYTRPEYSSGILALSAKAGKPVLGPKGGLLGRLIREHGLGKTTVITPGALAEAVAELIPEDPVKQRTFAECSRLDVFAEIILNTVCNDS